MEVDLACISRFTKIPQLEAIGCWLATRSCTVLQSQLRDAFQRVRRKHLYPLLAVTDVVLKFSCLVAEHARSIIEDELPKLGDRACQLKQAHADACEAMLINWITLGLVSAKCLRAVSFHAPDARYAGAVTCVICGVRQHHSIEAHMDMHFRSNLLHLRWSRAVSQEPQKFGVIHSLQTQKRTRKVVRLPKPERVVSPERILSTDGPHEVCVHCGDPFEKQWNDVLDSWVWVDASREDNLFHAACNAIL